MDNKVPNFLLETMLKNCNNLINDFDCVVSQLQHYSLCNVLIIPKKYEDNVINELELFNNDFNTPIAYEVKDVEGGNVSVTLYNVGVAHKESIIEFL